MKSKKMGDELPATIWKNWEKTGRIDFMKACNQFTKDEKLSPLFDKANNSTKFYGYVQELVAQGIRGALKRELVISTLQELVALHHEIPAIVLDAFNVMDAETSDAGCLNQASNRANFCLLVKECDKIVSEKLLKERLEIDTLQEVGILKNRNFYTKFIKIKTKLYYKQKKFNLLREETEGYAKLITELNQDFRGRISGGKVLDVVQSLIGYFNLDPNRVLDVILESFENNPEKAKFFIPLIKQYMDDAQTISEVLGSKFVNNKHVNSLPRSLYILTANLLQNEIISIDDIYMSLTPDDNAIRQDWDKEISDAKEYVRKLSIISLNKDKDEVTEQRENPMDKYPANQKLNLCEALIHVGDWQNACELMKRLPENYAASHPPIAMEIAKLLHIVIEPVYRRNFQIGCIQGKPLAAHPNMLAPAQAETYLEMLDDAIPMLLVLGPYLYHDPILMYKIIRLAKLALAAEEDAVDKTLYYAIMTLLDMSLLPTLSFLDCNCAIAEELWSLIKLYPYQVRYSLYSRWKNEVFQIYPELMRRRGDAEKYIKNIMKRVSKENIKPAGRTIGKLTHCSPGFLFDYVLVQIQVYDNLIHPVVDSLKYLTNLSYDVLGYCLIETLAKADKKRIKHDSTSISSWLQSLSCFCGAVFKKYNIELTGLLQFLANQLKAQKSLDLLILKEIVQKMAGIDTAEDLTMSQLNAMSGGELLKVEAGYFSQIRNTKKSSIRLKEAMADEDLAVTLCLEIAQQRYGIVYKETQDSHLKLIGKLYDQCQDTLVQFGMFLANTFSVDEYVKKLPSMQSMLLDFHIAHDVAFFLARPMFNHAINLKYDQLRKADANYKKMPLVMKQQKYFEAVTDVMTSVHESLVPLHPPKVWDDVTPQFLTTFWSLTMYDLIVPEESYAQSINKIKQTALNAPEPGSSKGKKESERYQSMIEKLQDEKRKQQEHIDKVLFRLKQEKDSWFSAKYAKNDTITRFLQLCIFPRCTFTAIDAVYCAKFLSIMHSLKTANFSTVLCYDRLFCDVTFAITTCTENEAMRYGRFLLTLLETLMRWHKSKEIFDKECADYPGFVTKFRSLDHESDSLKQVSFEDYRHVLNKWHYKLTKSLINCIDSKDYVQTRNALIVLIKIIPHFPVLVKLAHIIEKKVVKFADEEKSSRQDLYTLAISYAGQLKNKIILGQLIEEADFHQVTEKEQVAKTDANSDDVSKQNGDAKGGKRANTSETVADVREKKLKRSPNEEEGRKSIPLETENIPIEKSTEKDGSPKEGSREKHLKKDDVDKDRDREREKRRERKEVKDDRQYREDHRFIEMLSPKEDGRFSGERMRTERYEEERATHHYRDLREEREAVNNGTGSKHNTEANEPERDVKRRKVDGQSSKSYKHEERKIQQQQLQQQQVEYISEKVEKKERTSKNKEKREKLSEEEKELRKERKLGRKRDKEEALQAEIKRKRDEEKAAKLVSHQNGESIERDKYHHSKEISPYGREQDRSHDRIEAREKQRGAEGKRR